jgi:hypothetical protein
MPQKINQKCQRRIDMKSMTVTPAYGDDFRSKKAARDSWNTGHDFEIQSINGVPWTGGRYISIREVPADITEIRIRFNQHRSIVIVETNNG